MKVIVDERIDWRKFGLPLGAFREYDFVVSHLAPFPPRRVHSPSILPLSFRPSTTVEIGPPDGRRTSRRSPDGSGTISGRVSGKFRQREDILSHWGRVDVSYGLTLRDY